MPLPSPKSIRSKNNQRLESSTEGSFVVYSSTCYIHYLLYFLGISNVALHYQEADIPRTNFDHEIAEGLRLGLPGASSIVDKTIPTFSRGELPHFAGINTFLKAPYLEDATQVGKYDVAVVGVPFDGGCTYRAGTRFGPQGIRRISALYTPYNYEKGIDLREQMVRQNRFYLLKRHFFYFVLDWLNHMFVIADVVRHW